MKTSAGGETVDTKSEAVLKFMWCLMVDYHPEFEKPEDLKDVFGLAEINYYMKKIMAWMEEGLTENPTQATAAPEKKNQPSKSSDDSEPSAPTDSGGVIEP